MKYKKIIIFMMLAVLGSGFPPAIGFAMSGGESSSEEGVAAGPHFIELKPLIVPVFTKRSRVEILALNLVIEAKDAESSDKITEMTPKLRDGFIRSLYGRMEADNLIDSYGVLNVELLKKRLMVVADHVVEPGSVNDILLQGITHQRSR